MDKKEYLRYCLVIPSLQSGGMERVMTELANSFTDYEYTEIHLVLYGKSRDVFFELDDRIIVHKPGWPFYNNKRIYSTIRTIYWLRQAIKNIDPSRILSFGEYWNSFVLLSLRGADYPIFVSDRCQPDKYLGRFHEFLRKWLYPGADGIIAQTSQAKQHYEKLLNHPNVRVIGNPVRKIEMDTSEIQKENIVLSVGRLIDTKHHDRLIKIFDRLNRKNWKLVIIGGNAIKQNGMEKLNKIINDRGLQDRVYLTGTVSNVEEYYLKSKIFAFTSSSEGFPNVIGEAMSAGLPVVAYNCNAGPSDMIDHNQTGYLTDVFDDKDFEEKLGTLMDDPELRTKFGENAKIKIRNFSKQKISEEVFKFITGAQ